MKRMLLLTLVLPLAASGCRLFDGRCNYEHRSLILVGNLAVSGQQPGASPIEAELQLNETRDANPDFRILAVYLQGASVRGIVSVDLVDSADNGAVLVAHFAPGNVMTPNVWHADLGNGGEPVPNHGIIWSAAIRRDLFLIAYHGAGGSAQGRLRITEDAGWVRPYCS
jgi:hypothetical protein